MFEFNLTTFIFQIANFLVLLLVLARFFYRPVLRVMNRREQEIENRLESASRQQEDAEKREKELDEREETVRREAERLTADARARADSERQRIVQAGQAEAADTLKQARDRADRERRGALEATRSEIAHTAVGIAMNIVGNLAAAEVHDSLVDRLADSLADRETGLDGSIESARVRTARALMPEQRERLTAALKASTGNDVAVKEEVDASLVAGCQVLAGDRLIDMTLKTLASQIETEPSAQESGIDAAS